jgi:RNA polymerase sigma-70 factor, ECF subfamily
MAEQRSPCDDELVKLAQLGQLEAFTTLYDRYLPVVYRRVRYVIPEQDIEDVTQEVFMAVIKSLKQFRGDSLFSTWLRTLTNRQVANYYRQREPLQNLFDIDNDDCGESFPYAFRAEENVSLDDCIALRQALAKLPENYREILLMRFAEGLRFSEISDHNGQSLEATKSLFRRAVASLHKVMAPTYATTG